MAVLRFAGIISCHEISRARQLAMHEVERAAVSARVAPGPYVRLAGVLQDIVARSRYLVIRVSAEAEGEPIGPLALMAPRVRSDFVPVTKCFFQARPKLFDHAGLCANENRGLDSVFVDCIK